MAICDYALTIKSICESLASIDITIDDEDRPKVCLSGLRPQYNIFKTSILTMENAPTFDDLVSKFIIEERNLMEELGKKNIESDEELLYSSSRRGYGG